MGHFYLPALTALLLVSCSNLKDEEIIKEEQQKNYEDYIEFAIQWNHLFDIESALYHVYFYSRTCGHCARIKDNIFTLADVTYPYFYFCEYNSDIPIKSCIDETIGAKKVEDTFICGTPSLLVIKEKEINKNLCGEKAILAYIEEYLNTN